jgi:hypothetical protein
MPQVNAQGPARPYESAQQRDLTALQPADSRSGLAEAGLLAQLGLGPAAGLPFGPNAVADVREFVIEIVSRRPGHGGTRSARRPLGSGGNGDGVQTDQPMPDTNGYGLRTIFDVEPAEDDGHLGFDGVFRSAKPLADLSVGVAVRGVAEYLELSGG